MAEEQREISHHENNVSLGSAETAIPLTNVSISPTKKEEQKTVYLVLFGRTIYVESSSLESEETVMPIVDVPKSPAKEDLTTHCSLDAESSEKGFPVDPYMGILGNNPNINSNVTCAGNKDLTEDIIKFKKMRSLSKEKIVEEKGTRVLTELPPYTWTIKKTLKESDINHQCRLLLNTTDAENHIMRHLPADDQKKIQEGIGVDVKAYDHDTYTEHDMVLKRHVKTSKSYVFNGGWAKAFVGRRELKEGDKIGLFWGNVDSRIHFSVLERKIPN
ncbi:unnamed protein product [Arabidopsis thaliana]|uniref:(thale cress) hypothetical protein n=1 Tax=Arabidopsis thaliana TaxID=3702 RepID=A0A7G2E3Y9_ARATH|nr:unnamed protein product [Arabidopsis thaliana]